MSNVRKLFSINAIIGVSLAIGFLNNVAITGFFGLNRSIDAYFASSILGSMFMYMIVDYLGRNFLPIYTARFHESPEDAGKIASSVITLLAIVATATVAVLLTFSTPIFTFILPGFNNQDIEVVTRMFAIQAPSIVLMTINNFHQYVWQHDEHYNRVVFARLFVPFTLLIFIFGGHVFGNVYAIAMGFLGGHIISTLILAYRLPYNYRPRLDLKNSDVQKILRNSALLTGSGLITRLRGPIQQYFASQLGEGAISAVSIAFKMCKPIHESMLMGVRMIVFSRSSKEAAQGNYQKLAMIYDYALSAVLLGVMPLAVWMAMNAQPIINVVFLRGEFTTDMASLVGLALLGAVAGIVFHGLLQMLSNSFYAMQKIVVPLLVMPLGTVLFFFATTYLSEYYGVFGLTLAGSVIAGIMSTILVIALSIILPSFSALTIFRRMVIYFVPAMIGAYVGVEIANYFTLTGLLRLMVSFTAMVGVYVAALRLSGESVFSRIVRSVRMAIQAT